MNRRLSLSLIAILSFILLGLLIALQMKNVNDDHRQTAYAEKDIVEMQEQVMAMIRENDDLTQKNKELSSLIGSMGEELSGDNAALQAILDDKTKAEIFAGLTPVNGSGITLVITPSSGTQINAKTLLLLLNEMRAGGALAISIDAERIVAMTEIRDTGSTNPQIVINGNSYPATNTFTLRAIYQTDDKTRGRQLLETLIEQFGATSEFILTEEELIEIPGLPEDSMIQP